MFIFGADSKMQLKGNVLLLLLLLIAILQLVRSARAHMCDMHSDCYERSMVDTNTTWARLSLATYITHVLRSPKRVDLPFLPLTRTGTKRVTYMTQARFGAPSIRRTPEVYMFKFLVVFVILIFVLDYAFMYELKNCVCSGASHITYFMVGAHASE